MTSFVEVIQEEQRTYGTYMSSH